MEDKQKVSKENQEIFEQFDTDLKQIKLLIQNIRILSQNLWKKHLNIISIWK